MVNNWLGGIYIPEWRFSLLVGDFNVSLLVHVQYHSCTQDNDNAKKYIFKAKYITHLELRVLFPMIFRVNNTFGHGLFNFQ